MTRSIGAGCFESDMNGAPFVAAILPSRYNAAGDQPDRRRRPPPAPPRRLSPPERAAQPDGLHPDRRALRALVVRRRPRSRDRRARRHPLARRCAARVAARRMTSISRILAVWLTPAALLAVPAACAGRGPDGL